MYPVCVKAIILKFKALEPIPPEHKVTGSNPVGRTDNKRHLLTTSPL